MPQASNSLDTVQPEDFVFRSEFALESGEVLPELAIRYETYGDFKNGDAPAIWICCPFTTDAHAAGPHGWWDAIIGPGKPINTDIFFVICSNNLGGCKGTTGPSSIDPRTGEPYGSKFPHITIGDMVNAQKKLADHLGIKKLFAVIGGSMGGFQAITWALEYPDFVERCALIASGTRLSAQALGFEIVGRKIILDDGKNGLANARMMAHITYLSAESMRNRFDYAEGLPEDPKKFYTGYALENYLNHQGIKFVNRFDANSYLHLTWAMDNFNLEKKYGSLENAISRAKAEFLCVHMSSDWLFTPEESYKLTFALLNQKKIVSSVELNSNLGHDGFLLETKDLGNLLLRFLDVRMVEHRDENYKHTRHAFESTEDIKRVSALIPQNASVLDIGCGDGRLLHALWREKKTTGVGFDRSFSGVLHCLNFNVPIIQKDLDKEGLAQIADNSFDFVVFNRTLQETQNPREVLLEILRIGKQAVVTFPNFGNWRVRSSFSLKGHMPKNKFLPYEWHNTPNIHLFTLNDFTTLCKKENIRIKHLEFSNSSAMSKLLTNIGFKNLGAEQVVAVIEKLNPEVRDCIAVLDFGGQYAHLIANRVRKHGVFTRIFSPNTPVEHLKEVKGIIFSGGPMSVYEQKAPAFNKAILNINVPKLGICYGHQLIAESFGGKVVPGKVKEYGIANLEITDKESLLLKGIPEKSRAWMSHGDQISKLPGGFKAIASTSDCEFAAVENSAQKIYGIQFHPEVTHSEFGETVLENFALNICGCKKSWDIKSYLPKISEKIKKTVGGKKVFLLVSGGVDSTVAFVLLNRILGSERVLGLHIDSGLMRLNESSNVMDFLKKEGMDNLQICDASEVFLNALKGVALPEMKRKIIGETFLKVKDSEMQRLSLSEDEWVIAQGTIYPDTIESGGTENSDVIKTHHNRVQGVLELEKKGMLLEPLADLYKDEVRALGTSIGIPHELVWRHPFPGPGLGVRLLCSDGKSPLKSVGVQGDARTYAQPLFIESEESWEELEKRSTDTTNRSSEINRVVLTIGRISDLPAEPA
ncbi:MAG: glutamine-hydrolyzing GMP synthase, partial [Fibromonadales bacterium]|nr:glutamine-hydrolyzing GMP synthase [Fibromonadales bacterium]